MKKYNIFYNITLFFTISATLALIAIRTAALIFDFEVSTGYYSLDSFLSNVFSYAAVAVSVLVFLIAFLLRKSLSKVTPATDSGIIIFTSALLAFMIIAVLISSIFSLEAPVGIVKIIALALSVPAALYPLIGIALPIRSSSGKTVLGAFMLLWLFTVALSIYFNDKVAINNPNRSLELLAVAAVLFFFVFECRYTYGKSLPWCYIGFGFVSVVIGGLYSLPNILLALTNNYPDVLDITFEFILAIIWLYVLLRLCVYSRFITEPEEAEDGSAEVDEADAEQPSAFDRIAVTLSSELDEEPAAAEVPENASESIDVTEDAE